MNNDLQDRLAQNKADWLAHALRAEAIERAALADRHDGYFARYGLNLMAHVYRAALEQVLQNTPDAGRSKLLLAFNEALQGAIDRRTYDIPPDANYAACQSRKW